MGVFDSVGRFIGTMAGQETAPNPQTVPLDKNTQGLIDESVARAKQPDSVFAAQANQGVSEGSQSFNPNNPMVSQKDASLGQNPGEFDALRGVYASKAGTAIDRMKQKGAYEAKLQKMDYMNTTARMLLGQQQVQAQNYHMLTEAYNQAEAARAGFINSLFQGGNTAIAINAANRKQPSYTEENYKMPELGSQMAGTPAASRYGVEF